MNNLLMVTGVAMVMKDVATNFRWIYPSARSHAKDCVLAFRHFVAPGEEVGVFYSDAAPSIKPRLSGSWVETEYECSLCF